MRVEISESAHGDVLDGYWFYNRQEPGLGEYFSDTLYGEMASLRLYAGIHPKRYGFHMMLSRVFPYSIYYDIEGGIAKVYAVIDSRRDPDWVRMHISNVR